MNNLKKDKPHFSSFVWAGYECTYARNEVPERIDMLAASRHDEYCRIDYHLVKELGITTVREGLSWHQIDKGDGEYDFSRFESMMRIAKEENIQQIWDLNHFDFPDYIDPFSDRFVRQFAEYAKYALEKIRRYQEGPLYIAPINEISFFAWIGGDLGVWAPYKKGRDNGVSFKKQLAKASIAAMEAIWHEDASVRFIHIDPFMRRFAKKPANTKAIEHVEEFNEIVRFEAWDMIAGRTYPELGGNPKYLDIIGINYYFHNQEFVLSKGSDAISHQAMEWESEYRIPFWHMIKDVYDRYKRPIVITETGSFGDIRADWWKRTLKEIQDGVEQRLPIYGVCAYPTVDRPNSVNYLVRRSGLWDFEDDDLSCVRIPHTHSLDIIREYINTYHMR